MRPTPDLLADLRRRGVQLWADGDRLRFKAPAGSLDGALRAEMAARKRDLLRFLERATRERRTEAPPIRPRTGPDGVRLDGPAPLSFAQQRLWFLDQLEPGRAFYNMPEVFLLAGALDVATLRRAFEEILRRHEALRTTFSTVGEQPVQVVHPPGRWPLPVVDLAGLESPPVRRLAREEAERPFDLEHGPLLRNVLLHLGTDAAGRDRHLLLITMHHIVSDGWSLGVLARELGALYAAFLRGEPSPLPALPIQYADFAAWQRQWLRGEVLAAQLDYWRRQLAGLPPLVLPADRPRPAVQTFHGAAREILFPPRLAGALEALGRRRGATLFMTLLAAFEVVLGRHSGQTDFAVGSPIANRNRREVEGLIGFLVNSLVMRSGLARPGLATPNDPFTRLLDRVREVALEAYAHQDLPFEKLVEELRPERDLSQNPLFQVMFAVQNAGLEPLELPGLTLSQPAAEITTTRFDLEIHVAPAEGRLATLAIYNTDLFDGATVARLLRHFRAVLEVVAAAPGRRLDQLPMLSRPERHQLGLEWSAAAAPEPPRTSIHALFALQAERAGDAVAVVRDAPPGSGLPGEALSYRELGARAGRLAARLRRLGAAGRIAGLCLERSPDMVIGMLAVLQAGGAYLPLDPGDPDGRLALTLGDADADLVVTEQRLERRFRAISGIRTLCVDREADPPSSAPLPPAAPAAPATPESLAYVMTTSGSTGRPKGVAVPHAGVVRLVTDATYVTLDATRVLLQAAPATFDASTFELWGALAHGGRCVLARERVPTARSLERTIRRHRIDTLWLTASLFNAVVDEDPRALAGAEQLLIGGEALSTGHVDRFRRRCPETRLVNGYGPTESTTFACCHAIGEGAGGAPSIPIGRPIQATRVQLLDAGLRPVAAGVAGELWIGGDGLARGYLRRPALTAERFVPDPAGHRPGERAYRTGDLARFLSDGRIDFLGRLDHQVKIRGFRIEPGEVETVLGRHPAVQACAVAARDGDPGGRRLVAWVVTDDAGLTAAEPGRTALEDERVADWRTLYDDLYGGGDGEAADDAFNTVGWNSSLTGEPIPAGEMRRWRDHTVERILDLGAQRIWEIGCGTGLLLLEVASHCSRYLGTDFSAAALAYLRSRLAARQLPQVDLELRPADDFTAVEPGSFDAAVLSSVVQYFPGLDYLRAVLRGAVRAVAPGGAVLVADVRSLPLLEAFHASVELAKAPADLPLEDLAQRLRAAARGDEELLLDPELFHALCRELPELSHADVLLKRGRDGNEMTRYRYDAVLHLAEPGREAEPVRPVASLAWGASDDDLADLADLERRLRGETLPVEVLGVPNARVASDLAVLRRLGAEGGTAAGGTVADLAASADSAGAVEPEDLWRLGERLGCRVRVTWSRSGSPGCVDALFEDRDGEPRGRPWLPAGSDAAPSSGAFANDVLQARRERRTVPLLRAFLQERLPEYMVPAAFVLLDALPLTASGKVDRAALPAPEGRRPELAGGYVPPRTDLERRLEQIWREVLGIEKVGVHDDFFELGGHSLLATRVISRLRDALGFEVPLRTLFEAPTVASLAAAVETAREAEAGREALPAIVATGRVASPGSLPRGGPPQTVPPSFAQERLWFLAQLVPDHDFYNMPLTLELTGELRFEALRKALEEIVRRHQVLRTTFATEDRQPVQVLHAPGRRELPVIDLTALSPRARGVEAGRLADQEVRRPFDLESGPLLRSALLELGAAAPGSARRRYLLLATMHHIVSDGWSLGILVRELGALYAAFGRGEPSPLPELPVQYADFARWQRRVLSGERLAAQLTYWGERLARLPTLELPADRPRPAVPSFRGDALRLAFGPALSEALRAFSRQRDTTLYMTLLAGFQALVHRLTGQRDVAVGSPIANRHHREIEDLIGFFVNTLVLRADLSGGPPFEQVLEQARESALGAYAHQDLPFEKLVAELQPERDLSRNPLFQVVFAVQNLGDESLHLPGLELRHVESGGAPARFDLEVHVWEPPEGLLAVAVFSTDLFDATTVERLLRQFRVLLGAAVADSRRPVTDLPLLAAAGRHQLLVEWSGTPTAYPRDASLPELFARQARRTPDAVAAIGAPGAGADRYLTYGSLDRRAGALARALGRRGARPGERIGVCVDDTLDLLVGLLGILTTGGVYVPLDAGYPRERLAFMVEDTRIRWVVTREGLRGALPIGRVRALCLDRDRESLPGPAAGRRDPLRRPESLAYVIYTSGSTGRPKGIGVTHRAVVRLVRDTDYLTLGAGDRVAQASNHAFDALTFEVWGALLAGGCLLAVPREVALSPETFAAWIRRRRVGVMFLTTALANQIARRRPDGFATLRALLVGGETVDPGAFRAILAAGAPGRLLHVYGPTESTTFATWQPVAAVPAGAPTVPIGRPIANTSAWVLDAGGRPVPLGVAGELCLGGDGLARGYLARPALTARSFVPHPASREGGARLYRTGDLVRRRPHGEIEFLGRIDHQVKVRGFRIELGEIETVLAEHPAVTAAAVVVRDAAASDGREGDRRLVAFLVCRRFLPAAGWRDHLRAKLPDYMLPSAFVELEALPLSANGKVDRAALMRRPLPDAAAERPGTAGGDARRPAWRGPDEELLAGIWGEVLHLERVGRHDDFFELGGHSLLATQVVSRIRETFAVELPLRTFFEAPTVAAVAAAVAGLEPGRLAAPPLEPSPREPGRDPGPAWPLSFAQERLWFLDQLVPGDVSYNMPLELELAGHLDVGALERTLTALLRRHESLRTTFAAGPGRPRQVVHPATAQPLPIVDLADLTPADRAAESRRLERAEAARPFDLGRGPLWRTALLRTDPRRHRLQLTMHHIVSDGWSLGVLMLELGKLYAACWDQRAPRLPEPALQYADFARWQRGWLRGDALEAQLDFWRRRLAGLAVLELPTDRPRPAVKTSRGASLERALAPALSSALGALGRRQGVTPYMTLLAAFQCLLGRLAGQDDVAVGSPIANRNRRETEALIGFFVNTLVMRSDLSDRPTFAALLARLRRAALEAYAHQDLPFEKLVEELHPERDLARNPLVQVTFAMQNLSFEPFDLPRLTVSVPDGEARWTRFDLEVYGWETGEGLAVTATYNTDLFDATTVDRWLRHFEAVLAGVAAAPETRVGDLPLMTPAQRHQLLREWNAAEALPAASGHRPLHAAFEAWAERTPDAVAAVFVPDDGPAPRGEPRALTYAELSARARGLAQRLRRTLRRAGPCPSSAPELRVGLCVEPSLETAVGILGILGAGGAYVPLDPAIPAERLAFVAADAGVRALVTRRRWRDRVRLPSMPRLDVEASEVPAGGEPLPRVDPDQAAYVIYTSGSTGRPKGVTVSHRQVSRLFDATAPWLDAGPADAWTLFHSFAFDFSVWELWGALRHGGRLVVVPFQTRRAPEAFCELLLRERVSVLNQTPSAFGQLQAAEGARTAPGDLALRWVVFGGEALETRGLKPWFERHGERAPRLVNMYGITETTVHVTRRTLGLADAETGADAIGRPLGDLRLYVADRALVPVPLGVAGELLVGGAGVARGYLGRPGLTAERFVPDPFGALPGSRLYRSGDLARHRPRHDVEYLGRIDHQVQIRGFRVEMGEIEATLAEHPAVGQAVATLRADDGATERLVAYLVPDADRAGAVRRLLADGDGPADRELYELPDGQAVFHLGRNETDFLYREIFADGGYLRHGLELADGDVVFDVGANVGLFTLYAASRARGVRVYAFEPIPAIFDVLRANAELHGLDARLFELGLAARPGRAELTFYPHASVLSGRFGDPDAERETVGAYLSRTTRLAPGELDELLAERVRGERVDCALDTLSCVLRREQVERVDLLKVDVEKGELEVLEGLGEDDWGKIRQLVVEVHDLGGRLATVRELLAGHGFEVVADRDPALAGTDLVTVFARRPGPVTAPTTPPEPRWSSPERLVTDVRRAAEERLPDYMRPAAYVLLDALPLTPNGKVDRAALGRAASGRAASGRAASGRAASGRAALPTAYDARPARLETDPAPRTPVEELTAEIWARVLGVERVGRDDDFFRLGGHSLLATRVVSRARERLGVDLQLRALFETPTLGAFAARIEAARRAAGAPVPPLTARPPGVEAPLSFAQERLWFLDRLEPGDAAYNLPVALELDGELDARALERTFAAIVARHETLRTTFGAAAGRPCQTIHPAPRHALPRVDLDALTPARRSAEAGRLVRRLSRRPFDLARGPLLRLALLRLGRRRHVLSAVMHHIVSDGWSMGVLVREIETFYGAFSSGAEAPLGELPVQYADFACWQRGWLTGEVLAAQLEHWRSRLAGVPALELPADRPRPAVRGSRGATRGFVLPPAILARLGELCRRAEATLFMTLLAAFEALLARLAGQDDFTVGTPIANRNHARTEELIGFFVNTLVLRADLAGSPRFTDLLAGVRERALDAYAHQDLPFERLVEALETDRDLSRTPLFQVMLILQNAPAEELRLPGLRLGYLPAETGQSKFDLTLSLAHDRERLGGVVEYASDLFDAATVERLIRGFETLLADAVRDPARPVGELALLGRAERHQLRVEWNDTGRRYPADGLLTRRIAARAAAAPERTAVVFEGEHLTYATLARRAAALAAELRRRGAGAEVPVGVFLERSSELMIALLGILEAGGAYLPLDPEHPPERLRELIASAGLDLVLSVRSLRGRLPAGRLPGGPDVLTVDGFGDPGDDAGLGDAPPPAAGQAATMIYTSGSTGRPKLTVNTHAGLSNRLLWMQETYRLGPGDRVLQKTPVTFDVSVWELFWPLMTGASVVLAVPGGHRDPLYLADTIVRRRITTIHFVPSMLRAFLAAGAAARCRGLRRVFSSGEALAPDLEQCCLTTLGAELHNLYGPTEAAVDVSHHRCRPGDRPRVPIGRPVANTALHVADRRLRPVAVGVAGELLIGGAQVGRGYRGQAALTGERFVPDPFGSRPGRRLYRTGDLARVSPRGDLEYLGRLDHQVKVRGHRVEPGEIEHALLDHPAVREAVVLPTATGGDLELTAFVTGESPEVRLLRAHLARRLPDSMMPARFVVLETLPLSPNGKLDRAALARSVPETEEGDDASAGTDRTAPLTRRQARLAAIWESVLERRVTAPGANFFELGGHSLKAVAVLYRIHQSLEVQLSVREFFAHPTLAAQAERIAAQRRSVLPPIPRAAGAGRAPLSHAQHRLWVLSRLEQGMTAYNMPVAVLLEGGVDAAVLERAFGRLLERHASLRTVFPFADGEPWQVVRDAAGFRLERIDLRGEPDPLARARRLVERDATAAFDLERGPLLRAALLAVGAERPGGPERQVLAVNMHHIVSDGWSIHVLVRDLLELYAATLGGREPRLPALPIQYPDYAAHQRAWLASADAEPDRAYWHARLAGELPVLELPTDFERPPVKTYRGGTVGLAAGRELSARLHRFADAEGASLFMVLLAGVEILLHRASGQRDVLVASPVAGRTHPDLEEQIGFYVNTLVLREEVRPETPVAAFLAAAKDTATGAYDHQTYPFDRLVDELRVPREVGRSPIFEAMVVLQNLEPIDAALEGIEARPLPFSTGTAKFELTFQFVEADGELQVALEYNADLFAGSRIRRTARHLLALLGAMADAPGARLGELPMLTAAERHQLILAWNDTRGAYPRDTPLHALFAGHARRRPDRVAVDFEGESITYAALDRRADRMARLLRARGVGRETPVGLFVERSSEMVVGLLAILKAGGAYLPLDPDYPAARVRFMLDDARAPLVLTLERLRASLPPGRRDVLCLDAKPPAGAAGPAAGVSPDQVAYVMYTSGSTGRPKGVRVTHRGVVRLVCDTWYADFGPEDSVPQLATISFDASTIEIWSALANGGRLAVFPPRLPSLDELGRFVRERRISTLFLVTPLFEQMVPGQLDALRGLRQLLAGGDAMPPAQAALASRELPGRLVNLYGPTEGSTAATAFRVRGHEAGAVPIGRPLGNTRLHLLDARLEPVPIGVDGELCLGADCLGRDYLGRPARTAASFVPDPFARRPGERLYRTGDRARLRPDSEVDFLGRLDRQLKIRGNRVEPGELEAVLARHPRVGAAAVVAVGDGDGRRLVACLAPANGSGDGDPAALRAFAAERLPAPLLPSAFLLLDDLPRTPNGKVDRTALSRIARERAEGERPRPADRPPAGPRDGLERTVAEVWTEVLGIERPSVHDNFFDLGGHSLAMIKVHARLHEVLGRDLPMVKLFEHPTIAALTGFLESEPETATAAGARSRAAARRRALVRPRRGRR